MVTIATGMPTVDELLDLYGAVEWTAYTGDPELLVAAARGSHAVVTARDAGRLVGLARTVSDGATIVYVQDVLVHPEHQRFGIGSALLAEVLRRYEHVRQTVLLTDAEPGQRAFYESLGFVEVHDVAPGPLRSFVLLR
ncbi:GNAT family N-acetyltransferase [Curtobacterium sp. 1P10AnD]|uniref:GNAT family N-acetyltransferase n=1 Tax=Curtobacterium sp. 1P10AnD TaxID=3132283 RepID=UPI0039A21DC9